MSTAANADGRRRRFDTERLEKAESGARSMERAPPRTEEKGRADDKFEKKSAEAFESLEI